MFTEIPSKCFLTSPSTRLPLVQVTKTLVTINIFFAIELPASAKMPCLLFYNKKNEDYGEPDETMFTVSCFTDLSRNPVFLKYY